MNHPDFTQIRRRIDEAITFDDPADARYQIAEGLRLAGEQGCLAEEMYLRAQGAIISGQFEEAVGFLKQALILNPFDGAAYNDIALCAVETGRIEGVLEIFDQGIAVEPDFATIHHNKGWFLNKIGLSTEALACFEHALRLEPQRMVTWENMADVYEGQGRIAEALDAYRKALSLSRGPGIAMSEQLQGEIKRLEADKQEGDMKRIILGLIAALIFLPVIAFAQQQTPPQDEWAVFVKHQVEERAAFNKQIQVERESFLKSHPDIAVRVEAAQKAAQERSRQLKAAHRQQRVEGNAVPATGK